MPMNPKLRAFLKLPSWRTYMRTGMSVLILSYLGLMLLAANANHLLFHPPALRNPLPDEIKLHTSEGNDITVVYLPNEQAAYTVLFSYGNGDSVEQRYGFLKELKQHGWAVCAYDYPGYGTSTGSPSESGCYAAINAAYDYLVNQKHIPPARIVVYGQSMGTGPSVDLASREPVGGLVLQSAYLSIFRVVTHFRILPWDKFNNYAKINLVHAPLLSIHGQKDTIVPFWQGETLSESYQGPKTCLWLANAGHNDIEAVAGEQLWRVLEQYRKNL